MRTRTAAAGIAVAAALIVAGAIAERPRRHANPAAAAPVPLLGIDRSSRLVRLDPRSLRPVSERRLPLEGNLGTWAFSPDRTRLLLAAPDGSGLSVVDLERMREAGAVRTRARGSVAAIAWHAHDRASLVLASPGCCATGTTTIVTVDPRGPQIVARRRLTAGLTRIAEMGDALVLLLSPSEMIGPATVATVTAAGRVDTVQLYGLSAGAMARTDDAVPSVVHARRPGLAVDPARRRAYVIPAGPDVAEVDLATRAVDYHRLTPRTSLLERLRDLLEPAATAHGARPLTRERTAVVGAVRSARWLGGGRIAVAGYDADVVMSPSRALTPISRPAGLRLIDTRDWSVRTLDERTRSFRRAGGVLLSDASGLSAHRPNGRPAFRLFNRQRVEIAAIAGTRAYVRVGSDPAVRVVDLARGRVVATGHAPKLVAEPPPHAWE